MFVTATSSSFDICRQVSCYYICTSFHFDQPELVRLARANWTQAEDFIYLPHNNLRAILIIQRTKDHWRPLAGTVQLGKLENGAWPALSLSLSLSHSLALRHKTDEKQTLQMLSLAAQIRMLQQMQLLLTTTKAPNQVIPSAETSSLAGPPNELVHYQLAGRPSQ